MLVLSRRVGEAIIIGGNIRIVVLERKSSDQVSLGFESPRDITILREELVLKDDGKKKENNPQ